MMNLPFKNKKIHAKAVRGKTYFKALPIPPRNPMLLGGGSVFSVAQQLRVVLKNRKRRFVDLEISDSEKIFRPIRIFYARRIFCQNPRVK